MFNRLCPAAGALWLVFSVTASAQAPDDSGLRWYKGNTHTHTLNSDGDSTPDEVVRWYREHGYHFLVLTDHNFLTSTEALQALHGADERFLVIAGEEVTEAFGGLSLHVNGLDLDELVPPQGGTSVVDVLQRNVDAIREAGGVPHINHPNFRWSITREELQQVRNNRLFEVFNGHPMVNNAGGGGVPGLEEVWDAILASGKILYGIAVDDAHTFRQPGNPNVAGPGRGWVSVRAPRLTPRDIMESLERGDFYASTGVEMADIEASPEHLRVEVRQTSYSKYRIQFIGKGGRMLEESLEPAATYTFRGDEGYVRARVLESNGRIAWIQPVRVAAATARDQRALLLLGVGTVGLLVRLRTRSSPGHAPRKEMRRLNQRPGSFSLSCFPPGARSARRPAAGTPERNQRWMALLPRGVNSTARMSSPRPRSAAT